MTVFEIYSTLKGGEEFDCGRYISEEAARQAITNHFFKDVKIRQREMQIDYRCPECHGVNVEGTAWIDLNTQKDTGDEPPMDRYWCPDCECEQKHVEIRSVTPEGEKWE